MNNLFSSQCTFEKDIEHKYIEWMFERTRSFIIFIGIIATIFLIFFTLCFSCNFEHLDKLLNVLMLRAIMVAAIVTATISFIRLNAIKAQKILFCVLILIIFLAIYDTYFTVGEAKEFDPAAEMFSIYMFMIVPFVTVRHKVYLGLIYILGLLLCSIFQGITDIGWTMAYVLIVYFTAILVYYKVDFLFRMQFKSIIEEKEKASIDPLTGAYNRKTLHSSFIKDLSLIDKNEKMLVGILDIDCFKLYNDTYGHISGDKVLKKFSRVLFSFGFDKVYRFGGEEFVFTLRIIDLDNFTLPDICDIFKSYKIPHKTSTVVPYITASVGIVMVDHKIINDNIVDNSFADLIIMKADDNLYKAKNGGRNKVVLSESIDLSR